MTEGLLLVGASGLAREILAAGITGVIGIVDDNQELHETDIAGVPVVGSIVDVIKRPESLLVCVGPSASRRNVVRRLAKFGVDHERFATFVARSARIGKTSAVAAGSIVLDGAVITADASIGRHVVVMPNATITHDCVIEGFATLASGATLGGNVNIHEAAYIGMSASIRQGVTIGARATIGMGAVVLDDVPPDQTWVGVPARQLEVTP